MKIRLILLCLISCFYTTAQFTKISSFGNDAPFDRLNSNKAVAVGNRYFFSANEGNFGNELWVNDGSPNGNFLVKDITSGPTSTVLSNFVAHKGLLYFFANGGITGEELWRSDGTANGTYIVKDVNSVNSNLVELISDGQFLYFFPFSNQFGNEIWKSDGTSGGTQLLKDIAPGSSSSDGHSMFIFKNKLHFFAKSNNFDASELWTSDGTSAGTTRIKILNDFNTTIINTTVSTNDSLFYFTMDIGSGDQLWISDGKNSNTKVIKNINQSVAEIVVLPNNNALFTVKTGFNLDDIWVTDGTLLGTNVLLDLNNTIKRKPFSLIKFKGMAYILGNDKDNCLLLKTDGLASNTKILSKFLSTTGTQNEKLIPFADEFFVIAFKENVSKMEIFTANEFENSLRPIILNNEFNGRSPIPSDFRELSNNKIIFKADDQFAGRELYFYQSTKILRAEIKINKSIDCFGEKKGELEAIAAGGSPPYMYNWSNGSQSKTIQNLAAGSYTIGVTDSLGNIFALGTTLSEPNALNIDIQSTPETLYQKDGVIELNVFGGTLPYQFIWNTNEFNSRLINKSSGLYSVTVTDFYNCKIEGTHFLNRIGEFPLNAQINEINNIKCFGDDNGALEGIILGGVPPYTLNWSNGEADKLIQNLTAGNYVLTIIDSVGSSFIVVKQLSEPSPMLLDIRSTPETLFKKDGTIEVIVTGGTQPYQYIWNTNELTNILTNKSSGSYFVTVTDNNNCTIDGNGLIGRISEFPLTAQIITSKSISCYEGNDGVLEALPTGGLPPYFYNWSNGSQSKWIQNLNANNYSVTITDSLGNNYSAANILGQPSPLKLDIISTSEVLYKKNGTIEAFVTGGTLPYQFLWNTNESNSTLINKSSGSYSITVTDNNGCIIIGNHFVTRISEFPLIAEIIINKNIMCHGDKDGEMQAVLTGGTPPYKYLWSNGNQNSIIDNLTFGNYAISITDSLGNTIVVEKQLDQPSPLQIDFITSPEIDNGSNGSIQALVSGGIPPYQYYWNTADSNMTLNNLVSGTYSISVTDNNSCLSTKEVIIEGISKVNDLNKCNFVNETIISSFLNIIACDNIAYDYNICDLSGRIIVKGSFSVDEAVSALQLTKGMYIIYILNKNKSVVFTGKVIKI